MDGPELEWVLITDSTDVPEGGALGFEVGGIPVCVARSGGQIYAVRDRCTHENVPLSEGEVEDGAIECFMHGSRFDLATGRVLNLPAVEDVAVFPVRVEGAGVFVAVAKQQM